MKYLTRKVSVIEDEDSTDYDNEQEGGYRRIIWNGNVEHENCLVGYYTGYETEDARIVCEELKMGLPEPGNTENWTPDPQWGEDNWNGGSGNSGGITWSATPPTPAHYRIYC